jgi:hypothetical protein
MGSKKSADTVSDALLLLAAQFNAQRVCCSMICNTSSVASKGRSVRRKSRLNYAEGAFFL